MADEPKAPDAGQAEQAPSQSQDGKVEQKVETAPSIKSIEQVEKERAELEKKLGEQGRELGDLRKYKDQADVVFQTIWADQDLYNTVDKKIKESRGVNTEEPKENGRTEAQPSTVDIDTRRAMEQQIIDEFSRKYGLDNLPPEKRREEFTKVGNALLDLLDPSGNKTYADVMSGVSLTKLPRYLENAFFISNKEELVEKAKLEALTKSRENSQAAIGSIPSSGGVSSEGLTPAERETAKKLGISDDKYLKRKQEIAEATKGA